MISYEGCCIQIANLVLEMQEFLFFWVKLKASGSA